MHQATVDVSKNQKSEVMTFSKPVYDYYYSSQTTEHLVYKYNVDTTNLIVF